MNSITNEQATALSDLLRLTENLPDTSGDVEYERLASVTIVFIEEEGEEGVEEDADND